MIKNQNRIDEIRRYLRHPGFDVDPPEPEETETEDKSVSLSLFEASSQEKDSTLTYPEGLPVINHD